jgi:hypothetical protein
MFVQVIKGKAKDSAALLAEGERWQEEVKPGATGYLGGTFGIADDGTFVVFARFEDEAAAQANSARPEQGAWFERASKVMDGEPTFRESSDVDTMFDGGSDDAGFVQVMEGTVKDRAKAQAFEQEMVDQLRAARPDLLGSVRAWFADDTYAEAAYFTSEDEARKNEASADFAGPAEEYASLFGDMTFTDLKTLRFS